MIQARFKIFATILILVVFSNFNVSALSSDDKINFISRVVFADCQEKNIEMNTNFAATAIALSRLMKRMNSTNPSPILNSEPPINQEPMYQIILSWPYSLDEVKDQIKQADKIPWSDLSNGLQIGQGLVGEKILICEENYLTISKDDYYWNNIKLEAPRNEFNSYYAQNLADNGIAVAGNNNQVIVKPWYINLFWSQGTIGGAILTIIFGAIIWILKRLVYDKLKSKQTIKRGKK